MSWLNKLLTGRPKRLAKRIEGSVIGQATTDVPLAARDGHWQICRLATCDDLIRHKAAYRNDWSAESNAWGLKQMGTLFCLDYILRLNPSAVLEVGAGTNRFFDQRIGETCEYWMIDKTGFFDRETLEKSLELRRHTRFVDGLMGEYLSELPADYFDVVFSISALEHVPPEKISDVCRDMWRVLKPGGYILHSIDAFPSMVESRTRLFVENFEALGFRFDIPPNLKWSVDPSESANSELVLLEPLQNVYTYFGGGQRDDMWVNLKKVPYYWGTTLVASRKNG